MNFVVLRDCSGPCGAEVRVRNRCTFPGAYTRLVRMHGWASMLQAGLQIPFSLHHGSFVHCTISTTTGVVLTISNILGTSQVAQPQGIYKISALPTTQIFVMLGHWRELPVCGVLVIYYKIEVWPRHSNLLLLS